MLQITVVVILTERFKSFSCYIKYIIFQTHILREIHIDKTAQIIQQMKKTGSYPVVQLFLRLNLNWIKFKYMLISTISLVLSLDKY